MSKKICVFPGTFDPPTKGHIDIIKRALDIFDIVYVGLLDNTEKKFMFDKQKREQMLKAVFADNERVVIKSFDGLLVDFAESIGARTVIRGIRNEIDFSYEKQMHQINSAIGDIDTVIFPANADTECVSSTFIRELIRFKADISAFVPEEIINMIY